VIDKTDFRIPESALPGPVLEKPLEQLKREPVPIFRSSRYYKNVCDLRDHFGVDAVIHLSFRFGKPNHKVEIVDAGEKTVEQIADILQSLFDVNPWTLELMRVDLAADMGGAPVSWFQDHAYVNRKQYSSRIEKSHEMELQFVGMGTAIAQTIYAGKRPNLIRIYDKLGEWTMQLRRVERDCKRFNQLLSEMDLTEEQRHFGCRVAPTFKEYCRTRGYDYSQGAILTRIERQIGGGRFPEGMQTLGDLQYAHQFDPFDQLRIGASGPIMDVNSVPDGVPMRNWLAAIGLNTLVAQFGSLQLAHAFVLRHGNGNGRRILETLAECAPRNRHPLTLEGIRESYRCSTLLQTSPKKSTGTDSFSSFDEIDPFPGLRAGVPQEDRTYAGQV
jgi:hypothetical protein